MYKVHPRNLILGPFLTLLLTLGVGRRFCRVPTAGFPEDGSNADSAPRISEDQTAEHPALARKLITLGPFLTLILTVRYRRGTDRESVWRMSSGCASPPLSERR